MNKLEIMLAEMTLAIRDKHGFEISVEAPGLPQLEKITNPNENLLTKRDYYAKAYNSDLELINNTEIKIKSYRVVREPRKPGPTFR